MIYMQLVSHDQLFREQRTPPIILNDLDVDTQEDQERINRLLYTTYTGSQLDLLPSCDCGYLCSGQSLYEVCPDCGTTCTFVTDRPIETLVWIRKPEGVEKLMNPMAYLILKRRLTVSGVSLLDWFINPRYRSGHGTDPVPIQKIKRQGFKRGINFFYHNYEAIITYLVEGKVLEKKHRMVAHELFTFLEENRENLFSDYLPLPSNTIFVLEDGVRRRADPEMRQALDAVWVISNIDNTITPLPMFHREARAMAAVTGLADFYYSYFRNNLQPKEAWFRKHIYGTRVDWSFRTVITSLAGPHHREECHIPWSVGLNLLKYHLTSKLFQQNYTQKETLKLINESLLSYNPRLDHLMKELIAENGGKIDNLLQRNPSLGPGSMQMLGIPLIKTDVNDNTTSISDKITSAYNADYDGRALPSLNLTN